MRHVAQVMDFNSTEDQPALKRRGRINIDNVSLVFGTGNQANIAVQETSLVSSLENLSVFSDLQAAENQLF